MVLLRIKQQIRVQASGLGFGFIIHIRRQLDQHRTRSVLLCAFVFCFAHLCFCVCDFFCCCCKKGSSLPYCCLWVLLTMLLFISKCSLPCCLLLDKPHCDVDFGHSSLCCCLLLDAPHCDVVNGHSSSCCCFLMGVPCHVVACFQVFLVVICFLNAPCHAIVFFWVFFLLGSLQHAFSFGCSSP